HVQLACCDRTRRHVDEDRAWKIARKGDAERIRSESRLAASEWRDSLGALSGISHHEADETGSSGHQRIVGEPPDVALLANRSRPRFASPSPSRQGAPLSTPR